MRILINAATAVVGGGAQVAAGLIASTLRDSRGNSYCYAVSSLVEEQIRSFGSTSRNFVSLKASPGKLVQGYSSRHKLLEIESSFRPDIVYSIAAPSYVRFKSTVEVARVTEPWITHPNKWCYSKLSLFRALQTRILVNLKVLALKRIQHFNTQTQTSAEGLCRRLKLSPTNVKVIPNCPNDIFSNSSDPGKSKPTERSILKVFVLGHPYSHKNFDLIPLVCKELKQMGRKVRFVVTFPEGNATSVKILEQASSLGVDGMIRNIGKITLPACKQQYLDCDAVFLPTLLETSSVTFLEAMSMNRPIITTNLDFAHTACGKAAEYFEPCDPKMAANAILNVLEDEDKRSELVRNGRSQIAKHPSQEEIYRAHIDWVMSIRGTTAREKTHQ